MNGGHLFLGVFADNDLDKRRRDEPEHTISD
jgi:hypothetical protein